MAEVQGEILERKRGDTAPDKISVTDPENDNAPLDNTGYEYWLTINTEKNPDPGAGIGDERVSSEGVPGGADGSVVFPFTDDDADQEPGNYWYDIQQKDAAGKLKTIAKNQYKFYMDITKAT